MRRTLLLILCTVALFSTKGQEHQSTERITTTPLVDYALDEVHKMFTPPPALPAKLKSSGIPGAKINVEYIGFPEKAKTAFEYAVSIWEDQISSPVAIDVVARWEPLNGNVLAYGVPSLFFKNFDGALVQDVYYPVALAEKLAEKELSGKEPDLACTFNSNISWYMGTDGKTPGTQYDLVTAALHEIAHGLGFSGFFTSEKGKAYLNNSVDLPSIYDYQLQNKNRQRISDETCFTRPSEQLYTQLVSENLIFPITEDFTKSGQNETHVYAPSTWQEGSSLYHLNQAENQGGSGNTLMSAFKYKGEAIHSPGENTLMILAEMGWQSMTLKTEKIKDLEISCKDIPVQLKIEGEIDPDTSSVKIIFSRDYFTTRDSAKLFYDKQNDCFSGLLPVNFFIGNIQYYFIAESHFKKFRLPSTAPAKKFSFRIGNDYTPPSLSHTPVSWVNSGENEVLISAEATDNLGIKSVVVEYSLNGVPHEPVVLSLQGNNQYAGQIPVNTGSENATVEYRIIAIDNAANKNKASYPKNGFCTIRRTETLQPVRNWELLSVNAGNDFLTSGFEISTLAELQGMFLQTPHPYPVSDGDKERINLIAQLKYPVVLDDYSTLSFEEIVLVEPGKPNHDYADPGFYDYVIVEGSADNGKSWSPVTNGYDSKSQSLWEKSFLSSAEGNQSSGITKDLLIKRMINLSQAEGFQSGDTILLRFRLSSDKTVNGWGWAIKNLQIRSGVNRSNNDPETELFAVYPNPFTDNIQIHLQNQSADHSFSANILDLTGKVIRTVLISEQESTYPMTMNLSGIDPGVYLLHVTDNKTRIFTKKIVKL